MVNAERDSVNPNGALTINFALRLMENFLPFARQSRRRIAENR